MTPKEFGKLDKKIKPIFKIARMREQDRLKKQKSRHIVAKKLRNQREKATFDVSVQSKKIIAVATNAVTAVVKWITS